jgi:hypothetical protein
MDKLVEHYGVVLAESTIRRITEGHAQAIFEAVELDEVWPTQTGHEHLIAEMDGGMVPTVEPDAEGGQRGQGRIELGVALFERLKNCASRSFYEPQGRRRALYRDHVAVGIAGDMVALVLLCGPKGPGSGLKGPGSN